MPGLIPATGEEIDSGAIWKVVSNDQAISATCPQPLKRSLSAAKLYK